MDHCTYVNSSRDKQLYHNCQTQISVIMEVWLKITLGVKSRFQTQFRLGPVFFFILSIFNTSKLSKNRNGPLATWLALVRVFSQNVLMPVCGDVWLLCRIILLFSLFMASHCSYSPRDAGWEIRWDDLVFKSRVSSAAFQPPASRRVSLSVARGSLAAMRMSIHIQLYKM